MGGGGGIFEILREGGSSSFGNLGGRGGQKTMPSIVGGVDYFWKNPFNNILKAYLTFRVPIAGPGCSNIG